MFSNFNIHALVLVDADIKFRLKYVIYQKIHKHFSLVIYIIKFNVYGETRMRHIMVNSLHNIIQHSQQLFYSNLNNILGTKLTFSNQFVICPYSKPIEQHYQSRSILKWSQQNSFKAINFLPKREWHPLLNCHICRTRTILSLIPSVIHLVPKQWYLLVTTMW